MDFFINFTETLKALRGNIKRFFLLNRVFGEFLEHCASLRKLNVSLSLLNTCARA